MKPYFVYVDWTLEEIARAFYVGKGDKNRLKQLKRNNHHSNVAQKYGHHREVIFASQEEDACKEFEIAKIAELHTFVDDDSYNGIGCNYTLGGDGGRTPGWHHTEESKQLIREKRALQVFTKENRQKMSDAGKSKKITPEHKARLQKHLAQLNSTTNAQKAKERGKLYAIDPNYIRKLRDEGKTLQQIADEFQVTRQAIRYFLIRHSTTLTITTTETTDTFITVK